MNIFSCFDGISCGQQALFNCGIKIDKYYASEIDQRAIKVTQTRWPKTIQYGNIQKIKAEHFMSPIHLLMGGSPCQDLSVAGKGAGLSGARSGLFYEFVRLLNELQPTYFFLENVRMKKVYQDEISRILGVEPIYFDSALVSAQTRKRLYWTNIISAADFVIPDDRCILINDILERDSDGFVHEFRGEFHNYRLVNKVSCIDASYYKGIDNHQARTCVKVGENGNKFESSARVYSPYGKSPAIDTAAGGDRGVNVACMKEQRSEEGKKIRSENMKNGRDYTPFSDNAREMAERTDGKINTVMASETPIVKITTHSTQPRNGKGQGGKGNLSNTDGKTYCLDTGNSTAIEYDDVYRKLTPIEVERCFGLPDNYTKGISTSARYHGLGNGWEVNSIMQFFQHLPKDL